MRRVADTAKQMVEAGLIVIESFISPYRAAREFAHGVGFRAVTDMCCGIISIGGISSGRQ